MDDANEDRSGNGRAEELILRTIAAHADSLLRTARRHSICLDDAQDAYQRSVEIFIRHAHRLDAGRAAAWLHTVVKREAKALRRARQKLVASDEVDFDAHESKRLPTPEEQLLSFDMMSRSAEALQRLKPQELRALWLKAQGHSYSEIGAITGWSYTKVNRCLFEGRRAFLERYAGIEAGEECNRWIPLLSAIVDGEATEAQISEARPHLRNCPACRTRIKALRESADRLTILLPMPLALVAGSQDETISNLLLRTYEAFANGLHERAVNSATKAQALLEASSAGKVAAVAASAAAMAGGGYAAVDFSDEHPHGAAAAKRIQPSRRQVARNQTPALPNQPKLTLSRRTIPGRDRQLSERDEFGSPLHRQSTTSPEFTRKRSSSAQLISERPRRSLPKRTGRSHTAGAVAPEFDSAAGQPEFGG